MPQELKLNPHGAVGILSIVLMFGIAFFLNWNINWWYFSIAVVLYSGAVVLLTNEEEVEGKNWQRASGTQDEKARIHRKILMIFRWLLGCHLTLLFLAVGLFFSESEIGWAYFGLSLLCGLSIPFLLLRISGLYILPGNSVEKSKRQRSFALTTAPNSSSSFTRKDVEPISENKTRIHPHGLAALLLIILMVSVFILVGRALGKELHPDNLQAGFIFIAILLYVMANLQLNPDFSSRLPPSQVFRIQIGCHLAFLFLLVGAGLHFKDLGSITGFFIGSIAMGLVIPYLLLRGS